MLDFHLTFITPNLMYFSYKKGWIMGMEDKITSGRVCWNHSIEFLFSQIVNRVTIIHFGDNNSDVDLLMET